MNMTEILINLLELKKRKLWSESSILENNRSYSFSTKDELVAYTRPKSTVFPLIIQTQLDDVRLDDAKTTQRVWKSSLDNVYVMTLKLSESLENFVYKQSTGGRSIDISHKEKFDLIYGNRFSTSRVCFIEFDNVVVEDEKTITGYLTSYANLFIINKIHEFTHPNELVNY